MLASSDEKRMSNAETLKNLQAAFTTRVSPATHVPMELTEAEASQLLRIAPVNMILYSFNKFSNWLQRKKAEGKYLNREKMLKALTTTLQTVKSDSGRAPWKQRNATVTPRHCTQQNPEQVLELREAFQETCTDASWCITEDHAQDLLRNHSMETLLRVFSQLGQTFNVEQAQDCFDLLDWKLTIAA
jgi:hypothetical protein